LKTLLHAKLKLKLRIGFQAWMMTPATDL